MITMEIPGKSPRRTDSRMSLPDPEDGRRRLVQLTHDGHELARELVAIGPKISSETLAGLSDKEQQDLLQLLDRLGRKS